MLNSLNFIFLIFLIFITLKAVNNKFKPIFLIFKTVEVYKKHIYNQ